MKSYDTRAPRGGWAPGEYFCICKCGHAYAGDKGSWQCADCAYNAECEYPIRMPVRIHCGHDTLVIDSASFRVATCQNSDIAKAIAEALNSQRCKCGTLLGHCPNCDVPAKSSLS